MRAYDPEAIDNARAMIEGVEYAPSAYGCLDGEDAMVLVTEWDMSRTFDIATIKQLLKQPIVVNLRKVYQAEDVLQAGIAYVSVGRERSS